MGSFFFSHQMFVMQHHAVTFEAILLFIVVSVPPLTLFLFLFFWFKYAILF